MGFRKELGENLQDLSNIGNIDYLQAEFVLDSLAFANQTHIYHLMTRSYAEHIAIGDFYDCLRGLADSLAEASLGLGLETLNSQKAVNLRFFYDKSAFLQEIAEFRIKVTGLILITDDASVMGLNDTLINIQSAIDTLMYKLRLS